MLTAEQVNAVQEAIRVEDHLRSIFYGAGDFHSRITLDADIVLQLLDYAPPLSAFVPRTLTVTPLMEYICPALPTGGRGVYEVCHRVALGGAAQETRQGPRLRRLRGERLTAFPEL